MIKVICFVRVSTTQQDFEAQKKAYKDFNNLDDASKKNIIDKMIEKIFTKRENKNEYILEVIPTDVIKGKTFEFKIVTKSRSSKVYIKLEDIYLPL